MHDAAEVDTGQFLTAADAVSDAATELDDGSDTTPSPDEARPDAMSAGDAPAVPPELDISPVAWDVPDAYEADETFDVAGEATAADTNVSGPDAGPGEVEEDAGTAPDVFPPPSPFPPAKVQWRLQFDDDQRIALGAATTSRIFVDAHCKPPFGVTPCAAGWTGSVYAIGFDSVIQWQAKPGAVDRPVIAPDGGLLIAANVEGAGGCFQGVVTRLAPDGEALWQYALNQELDLGKNACLGITSSAKARDAAGTLYFMGGNELHALALDGTLLWKHPIFQVEWSWEGPGFWPPGSPTISGNNVYVLHYGVLHRFTLDGTVLGPVPLPQPLPISNDACGFSYYGLAAALDGNLLVSPGMEITPDGQLVWASNPKSGLCPVQGPDGHVYDSGLNAFFNGVHLWTYGGNFDWEVWPGWATYSEAPPNAAADGSVVQLGNYTTGLVVLTNDGQPLVRVTIPDNGVKVEPYDDDLPDDGNWLLVDEDVFFYVNWYRDTLIRLDEHVPAPAHDSWSSVNGDIGNTRSLPPVGWEQ